MGINILIIPAVLILFIVVFCIILAQLAKREKESRRRKEAELRLGSHSFLCPYCDEETPYGYHCSHCRREIDTTRTLTRNKYSHFSGYSYMMPEIYWRKPGEKTEDEIQMEIQQKRADAAVTAATVAAVWAWDKKRQDQKHQEKVEKQNQELIQQNKALTEELKRRK